LDLLTLEDSSQNNQIARNPDSPQPLSNKTLNPKRGKPKERIEEDKISATSGSNLSNLSIQKIKS